MAKKKISVGTWAYNWGGYADEPIALDVVAKKLQEYKFDGVELGIFGPHLSTDDAKDLNKVRAVKQLLDDHGLGVSGIAADFGKVPPMLASIPDYLDTVLHNVAICEVLGAKKMRTDTMSSGSAPGLRLIPRRNNSNSASGSGNRRGRVFSSSSRSQANSLRPLDLRSQVWV